MNEALNEAYEEIASYLTANTITRDIDVGIREKLIEMRKRIVKHATNAATTNATALFTTAAVEALANVFYCTQTDALSPLRRADALVPMCTKSGVYTLQQLAIARDNRMFHRVAPAPTTPRAPP